MNAYQNIMSNISLSEEAKLRIFQSLQSDWIKERSQNSFPRKLKIGASVAMASIVAILSVIVPISLQNTNNIGEHRVGLYIVGIDTPYSDDNGTFCWREIACAKTILSGDNLYESSRAGFLIVKAEFNFASYSLRKYGIKLRGVSSDSQQENEYMMRNSTYFLNYHENKEGAYECKVQEDGDLNLNITKAISADLHIFEEPGEVHGTAFLCIEINDFILDYLSYMHEMEMTGGEIQGYVQTPSYQDINIELNNIWKPEKYILTEIGCSFAEVNFYDSYEI